jgi:hypothetical protein
MILLHDKLPCSENFFRYFKNYDRYMEEKQKGIPGRKDSAKSPLSDDSQDANHLRIQTSPKNLVRAIESPKNWLGLSPLHRFMQSHSPGSLSPVNRGAFNVDT